VSEGFGLALGLLISGLLVGAGLGFGWEAGRRWAAKLLGPALTEHTVNIHHCEEPRP
jgi:hypothetical protein